MVYQFLPWFHGRAKGHSSCLPKVLILHSHFVIFTKINLNLVLEILFENLAGRRAYLWSKTKVTNTSWKFYDKEISLHLFSILEYPSTKSSNGDPQLWWENCLIGQLLVMYFPNLVFIEKCQEEGCHWLNAIRSLLWNLPYDMYCCAPSEVANPGTQGTLFSSTTNHKWQAAKKHMWAHCRLASGSLCFYTRDFWQVLQEQPQREGNM